MTGPTGAAPAGDGLVVRVVPDVPALAGRELDYLVPAPLADRVGVGTMVRIPLQGRRAGAWVVAVGVTPAIPAAQLRPIARVTGWGPPEDVVALARWASWRWAGRLTSLLRTASPPTAVAALAPAPRARPHPAPVALDRLADRALREPVSVVRLPPAADVLPWVLAACGRGPAIIVTPSVAAARVLGARLRRAGLDVGLVPRDWARLAAGGVSAIGARAAVWAPVPGPAAVVVIDEHDEALQEERVPTWHAREVALERARRAGVPCVLMSPVPSLEALAAGPVFTLSRSEERAGWPVVDVIDRSDDDPFAPGPLSERLTRHLRRGGRAVCVVNRRGRAALLACTACGTLARCEACGAAVRQDDGGLLRCARCGLTRPLVCASCGSRSLKNRKPGTARLREELAALLGEEVDEVTALTGDPPRTRVVVGTEAALHRVDSADVVAFLDLDDELLAPRYRANEAALALLARAARLLGGRDDGGRLVLQTRFPRHEVVQAVLLADPGRVAGPEADRRRVLRFPPAAALAAVSGPAAAEFVAHLGAAALPGVEVLGPAGGTWLVRAPDHRILCDALATVPRPAGRCRVEVDPLRV